MFRKALNELTLEFAIQPAGPLLIKSSQESASNPLLPSMNFVRSTHPIDLTETIYLPGSSLKGIIRSRAEQIARTLDLRVDEFTATHIHKGHQDTLESTTQNAYKIVCSITRIFGSTNLGGRFLVSDFYPDEAINTLPIRQMVAIDRRSGASANTFTMEVALPFLPVTKQAVIFRGKIHLSNFERWHLGLLALVLRDMMEGILPIGFGSSRGLGQVQLDLEKLLVVYPALRPKQDVLHHVIGVAELMSDDDRSTYGVAPIAPPIEPDFSEAPHRSLDWGREEISLEGHPAIEAVFRNTVYDWQVYVEQSS